MPSVAFMETQIRLLPTKGSVKTSISLPSVIHTRATKRVQEEGYHSLSEYVHFLIRKDAPRRRLQRPA
jgi:Arc/MetJ-type ribon-helix-helix transcriptional regulator